MFFTENFNENNDDLLIQEALEGNKQSLEKLIKTHQDYVYNVALRLFLDPNDALDATQEVLIKVITHLNTFNGQSQFRTWLYRIVFNHFVNSPERKMEKIFIQFDRTITDFTNVEDSLDQSEIEEVRILCTTAMLMCLSREQRLLYIIGEVFRADHTIGAALFEITPANYRVKLHRAKVDLMTFVTGKCGIINPKNACRCPKKTKIMVEQEIIDKDNLRFNTSFTYKVSEIVKQKREALSDEIQLKLQYLFADSPFQIKNELDKLINDVVK
ncbi:RNA polymerase sigma factor [Runella slithyformis]|uniref:RNA polymerase, sigma-24 subunit, ECF subfamily n=1 Tax=Runella slithyformis (strain ATCC 29530 / DSM 19594 / LMG 11500 / NCIMB 11436 / LSU 4) TaxID=761193 RepID=A0A7U4E8S2_RUNSL|nr:RNA polymerase sigma factor [Runella slithyformis]AEI51986.1 RNA polymerase, sigma-24 subunit, ECF subfamily [Runella slithyformis DSM 19594]